MDAYIMRKEIKNGICVLYADAGKVLQNGEAIGTEIWLAPQDSEANWQEVDPPAKPESPPETYDEAVEQLSEYRAAYNIITTGQETAP